MGEAVTQSLWSAGAKATLVANRTFARAEALAGRPGLFRAVCEDPRLAARQGN